MIEVTEEVLGMLSKIYKPKYIFLKGATILKSRKYKFVFMFPEYECTLENLEHVSSVQMCLALNQAFYAVIFTADSKGHLNEEMKVEANHALSALMTRMKIKFMGELKANQEAELEFTIEAYGKMYYGKPRNFFRITYTGFISGEAEAMGPKSP